MFFTVVGSWGTCVVGVFVSGDIDAVKLVTGSVVAAFVVVVVDFEVVVVILIEVMVVL